MENKKGKKRISEMGEFIEYPNKAECFDMEGNPCPTPYKKIRSKGSGRGEARGRGKGPIGVPYKKKKQ